MLSTLAVQIGYFIIATFMLWVAFVNVMEWKKNKDDINKYLLYILYPIAFLGLAYDVIFNIVYGSIMFMELPHYKRLTLTARLKRIGNEEPKESWRFKLAFFMCKYLIEPWDANHCRF